MSYANEYQKSIQNSEQFWLDKAKDLPWFKAPSQALSSCENGLYQWFADAQLNTCYMALDYHVKNGRGQQTAIIYDSPVTATKQLINYQDLLKQVASFAGLLRAQGVTKGDRVVIYMPMIPQALIAMLAVARLGAVHSVVFGGFSANELAEVLASHNAVAECSVIGIHDKLKGQVPVPSTIDDPASVEEIQTIMQENGLIKTNEE